jgi:signal transduction histidine kinase
LQVRSDIADVFFDPAQLGRALDNMIINALQHTPTGGEIAISMTRIEDTLRIVVADTGSGVATSVRDNLFEPFASGRPDGTGLGLAIAREIAGAHGGSIRSVPCVSGATFEIDLPWRAS